MAKFGKTTMAKTKETKTSAKSAGGNKWLNFLKSYREKNATKNSNKKQSEILKTAGALWKSMSEAEKSKYATGSDATMKK
ncbi:CLUMA_CG004536, isoform A [Clunio marinus]|uniref:CLUMA_CG004536, isoform A n=1 Tax=Clunio marinus TaxID=568069 RepID=A0A1J1HWF0_9DIPT|nr:CLUMA_CG004536, isoform A [Clunio marinus]